MGCACAPKGYRCAQHDISNGELAAYSVTLNEVKSLVMTTGFAGSYAHAADRVTLNEVKSLIMTTGIVQHVIPNAVRNPKLCDDSNSITMIKFHGMLRWRSA